MATLQIEAVTVSKWTSYWEWHCFENENITEATVTGEI
jgi:hypothetical protein